VLRIEAGRPRLGAELSQAVLPPEARLEGSISYTKGCYIGQEIVARLRSRGHVNHLLVGLRVEGPALPARGASIRAGDAPIGEVTSAARSPHAGVIALGFVRVGHDAPGTVLAVDGARAQVAALPFVVPSRAAP
jgi:folate-binding protein YgfZ